MEDRFDNIISDVVEFCQTGFFILVANLICRKQFICLIWRSAERIFERFYSRVAERVDLGSVDEDEEQSLQVGWSDGPIAIGTDVYAILLVSLEFFRCKVFSKNLSGFLSRK